MNIQYFTSLHLGARCSGDLHTFSNCSRYQRIIAKYVSLKRFHTPDYTFASDENPSDPLKPCVAPGQTILPGGIPMHTGGQILDQKGGAASPPPHLGVSIHLGLHWDYPCLEVCSAPGQRKVSGGGPLGFHQKRKYIPEYGKVSGVRILQCSFVS